MTAHWIERIARAKAFIDNGMCRVGPGLRSGSRADGLLVRGAGRAIALGDAIVALCRQDHAEEALPVLRHLAETAAAMGWLVLGDTEERSRAWAGELREARWDSLWDPDRFRSRVGDSGAEPAEAVLQACRDFVHGGDSPLPWGHVFDEDRAATEPEAVLRLTAYWMGRTIKALDARWPGDFPGAEQAWDNS